MYHDGNGLPLKIGDIVLFRPQGETTRRIPGVIIDFTPKKVHVIRESDKKTTTKNTEGTTRPCAIDFIGLDLPQVRNK